MIKEAIDRIVAMAAPTLVQVHDRTFTNQSLRQITAPVVEPLVVHSLSSFIEYMNEGLDKVEVDTLPLAPADAVAYIHVESEARVVAFCAARGDDRVREALIVAETYRKFEFPVRLWLDQETFVTNALVHFIKTSELEDMLKIIGNLRGEQVVTAVDDGFTQKVTASSGVTKVEQVEIPNPIGLRPYRTFAEVAQPESQFVLRLRRGDGDLPTMALFPISDQRWREEAVADIKSHLRAEVQRTGVPILG